MEWIPLICNISAEQHTHDEETKNSFSLEQKGWLLERTQRTTQMKASVDRRMKNCMENAHVKQMGNGDEI